MIKDTTSLPAIGSFFVSSYGYDQTNINFYQVVGYTASKRSIRLQPVANKIVNYTGPMSENVVPNEALPRGGVMTKRLNPGYGSGMCVRIDSVRTAFEWDGKPECASHYH